MTAHLGVIRTEAGLTHALATIAGIEREAPSAASRNMATAALLIAAAAWRRRESRGAHFRSDYPKPDPTQAHRSFITLDVARALADDAVAANRATSALKSTS
jgi:L-aspartate oxidase